MTLSGFKHGLRRVGLTIYFAGFFVIGFHLGSCVQAGSPVSAGAHAAGSARAATGEKDVPEDAESLRLQDSAPAKTPSSFPPEVEYAEADLIG